MQGLEDRLKVKDLRDILVMIFKLAIDLLSNNTILFINNYFTCPELAMTLRGRRITVYRTIKSRRKNLSELLIQIKTEFVKNIPYRVLTAVI